jgi:hypothetical protein
MPEFRASDFFLLALHAAQEARAQIINPLGSERR